MKDRFILSLEQWEYIMRANRGEISMAKVLIDGKKVLFHHWGPNSVASPELEQAWKEATLVVCCAATSLPWYARAKHLAPKTEGVLITHPFLNTKTNMVHVKF